MKRRAFLWGSAASLALPPVMSRAQDQDAEHRLIETARAIAGRPYRPDTTKLSAPFERANYDSYRGIRTRPGVSGDLALGSDYRADLLPPGWLFREPVAIGLPGHDTRFSPALYTFDQRYFTADAATQDAADMGFSGLRLRHRLNVPDRWDDVLVLQGASYFRALAKDTVYGLSARALALGTGGPAPEEFPRFTRIEVFGTQADLRFGCLIDSTRASAALVATLRPGTRTVLECALHLFPRVPLADAGIAPLTSMFTDRTWSLPDRRFSPRRDYTTRCHHQLAGDAMRPLAPEGAIRPFQIPPARFRAVPNADRFRNGFEIRKFYHAAPQVCHGTSRLGRSCVICCKSH